mgnify:CR=1 FL=1
MEEISEILKRLDNRLAKIEEFLPHGIEREWYTVSEVAEMLNKKPFTIREWCRFGRINAEKRKCGRGRTSEWVVSRQEIQRYRNFGLLPLED